MKIYKLIALFIVISGCISNVEDAQKIYAKKERIYPVSKFSATDFCEVLQTDSDLGLNCEHRQAAVAKGSDLEKFITYINGKIPEDYFAKGNSTENNEYNTAENESNNRSKIKHLRPDIEAFTLPVLRQVNEPPILYTSLSPEGQRAILEYVSKRATNAQEDLSLLKELLKIIRYEGGLAKFGPLPGDPLQPIRLIMSATLNSIHESDRMQNIFFFIHLQKGAKFIEIRTPESVTNKVILGKLSAESTLGANLGLEGPSIPGVGGKVTGGGTYEFKRAFEKTLAKEFAVRTIKKNTSGDTLMITQSANTEQIDLSGNVIANVSIKIKGKDSQTSLTDIQLNEDETLKKMKMRERLFVNAFEVPAIIAWVAQVRAVERGNDTPMESDDIIRPVIFKGVNSMTMWTNPMDVNVIGIPFRESEQVKEESKKEPNDGCKVAILLYERPGQNSRWVSFENYLDAVYFKNALIKKLVELKQKIDAPRGKKVHLNDLAVGFSIAEKDNDASFEKSIVDITEIDTHRMRVHPLEASDFPLSRTNAFDVSEDLCKDKSVGN
jgi:hypothetical protein